MITLYCWEGDSEAEDLLETIRSLGYPCECHFLDAEVSNASPHAVYQDKVYWNFSELLATLRPGDAG